MLNLRIKKSLLLLFSICVIVLVCGLIVFLCFNKIEMHDSADDIHGFENNGINVHFIDVGQGDCALVQTPNGNILIDAGTPESKNDIIEYIDSIGVCDFKYAIFTHPHSDHIGSAAELINRYDFENVILPDALSVSVFYENMLNALEKENCNVILGEAGYSFELGEADVNLFAPRDYYYQDDLNDMSIVAKLTYGEVSFLFTGDAEKFSERQMLKYDCDLKADILKVAHHGSSSSSGEEFIYAVSPSIAIISAGKDNDYGHPHRETKDILKKIKAETYITYDCGNIVIFTDGDTYNVMTEK